MSVLARFLPRASGAALVIEPMRRRHVHQVLEIERAAYPKPWTAQVFHDELEQAHGISRYYVVARRGGGLLGRGGDVVGYAGLMFVAGEAHVTNIAVHPDQRRTGVATSLLLDLADVAIARGAKAWTLEVRASSTGAQALYRGFGFAPAGVRARYYENVEDAIVMWCHDIGSDGYARRLDAIREVR